MDQKFIELERNKDKICLKLARQCCISATFLRDMYHWSFPRHCLEINCLMLIKHSVVLI